MSFDVLTFDQIQRRITQQALRSFARAEYKQVNKKKS